MTLESLLWSKQCSFLILHFFFNFSQCSGQQNWKNRTLCLAWSSLIHNSNLYPLQYAPYISLQKTLTLHWDGILSFRNAKANFVLPLLEKQTSWTLKQAGGTVASGRVQIALGPDHVQVNCSWKCIVDWKWIVGNNFGLVCQLLAEPAQILSYN